MTRILFTNVGRRTYLLQYAMELQKSGYDIEIFASDTSVDTAALWISPTISTVILPRLSKNPDRYIEQLYEHCIENDIKLIIPLMDFELPVLARHRDRFKKSGIFIIISNSDIIETCLNKRDFYTFCIKHGISTPKTYFNRDAFNDEYPVVRKHIYGSGSIGLNVLQSEAELASFDDKIQVLQEYIEGDEYGIDILNDQYGNYLSHCVKLKLAMRAGETDKAEIVDGSKFMDLAHKISKCMKHIGSIDLDVMVDREDRYYVIDVNPRFGGGYPFSHLAGYNYLKAIIDMATGKELSLDGEKRKLTAMKGITLFFYEH